MCKKSLLFVALFSVCFLGFSQEVTIGLKGGVNYYTNRDIQGTGSGYTNDVFPADKVMGNQYGAFVEVNLGGFLIRPEVLFTSLENSYNFPTKPAAWTSSRLDIPVMFGYHVVGPVKVVMGPVFSNISDFYQEGLDDHSAPIDYDKTLLNLQFGVIFEYNRFGIDIRYEYGLKKVPFQEQRVDFTHGYQGYGINLANMHEFKPGQLIISLQIGVLRFSPGQRERKRSFNSDWRNHKRL